MANRPGRPRVIFNPKSINLEMEADLFEAVTKKAEEAGLRRVVWIRQVLTAAVEAQA